MKTIVNIYSCIIVLFSHYLVMKSQHEETQLLICLPIKINTYMEIRTFIVFDHALFLYASDVHQHQSAHQFLFNTK